MPPSPSDQAGRILAAALDLAPEDREAFLATACGNDSDLREEVRALIADHEALPTEFRVPPLADVGLPGDLDVTLPHTPGTGPPPPSRVSTEPANPNPAPADDMPTMLDTRASVSRSAGEPANESASGANPDAAVPFIFGNRIAQGGMGAIAEAEDCKLGRKIAVKVMLLEAGADEEQRQRFVQEAAVLGRLEHPNIVPIHDLGRDTDGSLYYTMKLVQGHTLQDILNDLRLETPDALHEYTLERLLTVFRKVCDAIAFAHSRRILHRDLKPENIMVGEFGEVLVMDWGLAKVLDAGPDENIDNLACTVFDRSTGQMKRQGPEITVSSSQSVTATQQGAVMGTPKYMSPEQALGRIDELDERSDIFSLGGILYAILTLRPPVEGKTVEEVLANVTSGAITPPTAFGVTTSGSSKQVKGELLEAKKITPLPHIAAGRVPPAISAVAMKALTLDKAKRYQTIEAFSADIEKFQGGFATAAEQAGLGTQLVLLIKRNKGIFSTAAAAWLLITVLAVWFVFNLRASEARAVLSARKDRAQSYSAQLRIASTLIGEHDLMGARALLEGFFPQPGEEDIRGFEWRHLWAQAQTEEVATLGDYRGGYAGIAVSPDKEWIARNSQSGITVQRVSEEKIVTSINTRTEDGEIYHGLLRFSPDGRFLISATPDSTRRWRTGPGTGPWEEEPIIEGVGSPFVFLPNGSQVAARSGRRLTVRNSENWTEEMVLEGFLDSGNTALKNQTFAISPDGDFLYAADRKRIRCWNLKTRKEIHLTLGQESNQAFELDEWPYCLAMSLDGLLAIGLWNGQITLWDSNRREVLQTVDAHRSLVSAVAFTGDGSQLITTSADRGIGIFDIDADGSASLRSRLSGHEGEIWGLTLVPESNRFYTGSTFDNSTRLWEVPSSSDTNGFQVSGILAGKAPPSLADEEVDPWTILPLEFETGPEYDALIAWTTSGFVRFDLDSGEANSVAGLSFPAGVNVDECLGIHSVDPDPMHTQIARREFWAQGTPSEIVIWNLKTGEQVQRLPEPGLRSREGAANRHRIKNPFAFSPDGSLFATANETNGVRIWNCGDWSSHDLAPGVNHRARLCFSADNGTLVVFTQSEKEAQPDHGIAIDVRTGEVIAEIELSAPMISVAVSPDGRTLAAGMTNDRIELWDLEKGEKRASLNQHRYAVFGLAFSPDGRTLASTGDSRLLFWNVETGSELMTLVDGEPWQKAPLFSPDGRFLVSYIGGKQLRVWRAPAWEEIK